MPLLAALVGALLWIVIAAVGNYAEAWDSPLYFPVGLPIAVVIATLLGALAPKRAWRWGGWLMGGQGAALLVSTGVGSLLPLGAALLVVQSVPCMLAALAGGWLRRRLA